MIVELAGGDGEKKDAGGGAGGDNEEEDPEVNQTFLTSSLLVVCQDYVLYNACEKICWIIKIFFSSSRGKTNYLKQKSVSQLFSLSLSIPLANTFDELLLLGWSGSNFSLLNWYFPTHWSVCSFSLQFFIRFVFELFDTLHWLTRNQHDIHLSRPFFLLLVSFLHHLIFFSLLFPSRLFQVNIQWIVFFFP